MRPICLSVDDHVGQFPFSETRIIPIIWSPIVFDLRGRRKKSRFPHFNPHTAESVVTHYTYYDFFFVRFGLFKSEHREHLAVAAIMPTYSLFPPSNPPFLAVN